jgi:hypothetical protein
VRSALLVHGLGRTPVSMFPLAGVVRRAKLTPHFFGYSPALEPLDRILRRLVKTLNRVRPAFVVTHSLGGVLTRLALPQATHLPQHLNMLAPPNRPPRAAAYFWRWLPFRLFSGTCGRFLAHAGEYDRLQAPSVPCTVIAGTAGPVGRFSPFGMEPNDGVVSVSETELPGAETVLVPAWHTWIMAHPQVKARVAAIMTARLSPTE